MHTCMHNGVTSVLWHSLLGCPLSLPSHSHAPFLLFIHSVAKSAQFISEAMADSGLFQRKVVLGVDASEHCERAFDCK